MRDQLEIACLHHFALRCLCFYIRGSHTTLLLRPASWYHWYAGDRLFKHSPYLGYSSALLRVSIDDSPKPRQFIPDGLILKIYFPDAILHIICVYLRCTPQSTASVSPCRLTHSGMCVSSVTGTDETHYKTPAKPPKIRTRALPFGAKSERRPYCPVSFQALCKFRKISLINTPLDTTMIIPTSAGQICVSDESSIRSDNLPLQKLRDDHLFEVPFVKEFTTAGACDSLMNSYAMLLLYRNCP